MRFINLAVCAFVYLFVVRSGKFVVLIHGKRREHGILRSGDDHCVLDELVLSGLLVIMIRNVVGVVIHQGLTQDNLVLVIGFKRRCIGLVYAVYKFLVQLVSKTGIHARRYGSGLDFHGKAHVVGHLAGCTVGDAVTLRIAVLGGVVAGFKLGIIGSGL